MSENESLFINRELSWLRFNSRVLAQCEKNIPLLEKLKFIAIYTTNLDEFYMIRIAGLKQLFAAGVVTSGSDGMSPLDQLREIRKYLQEEQKLVEAHYNKTKDALAKEGLLIKNYDELDDELKAKCDEYFFSNILPVIVPIAVDTTHPFPHLNNLSFSLAVKLADIEHPEILKYGMIRISRVLPRFTQPSEKVYVPIETIVHRHAEEIFPGYKLLSSCAFRVTRNADIVIEEEEADDFMMILEQGLKLRRKGAFVRMQIEKDADKDILEFLNSHMKIFHKDIFSQMSRSRSAHFGRSPQIRTLATWQILLMRQRPCRRLAKASRYLMLSTKRTLRSCILTRALIRSLASSKRRAKIPKSSPYA